MLTALLSETRIILDVSSYSPFSDSAEFSSLTFVSFFVVIVSHGFYIVHLVVLCRPCDLFFFLS